MPRARRSPRPSARCCGPISTSSASSTWCRATPTRRSRCRRRSTRCRSIAGASSAPRAWSSAPCARRRPASPSRCGCSTSPARPPRSRRNTAARRANPRVFAHTIADEIHKQQRNLTGVARTKLTFSSDRDGERMKGTVYDRRIKEIYIADYDGANPRRITVNRSLNINPVWSSDGKAIAYTSYRRGNFPDIYIQRIYEGTPPESPAHGTDRIHNFLPAWSPDGTQDRVHDQPRRQPGDLRDGRQRHRTCAASRGIPASTRRRRGRRPATRSRSRPIAPARRRSTSSTPMGWASRGASPSNESWADRATWSPAPFNEIAYAARSGPGFDIKIYDVADAARRERSPTAKGSNESPAFSPTGRHLAFASTRAGQPADLRRRPRRQRSAPGHQGRQQLHAELVALAAPPRHGDAHAHATPSFHRPVPRHRPCRRRCRQRVQEEEPADRAADAAAARHRHDGQPAAGPARAGDGSAAGRRAARAVGVERRHGLARRDQQEGHPRPGVLRVRQRRDEQRGPGHAGQERRDDEAVSRPGSSRSRATATSAAPPNTTWRSASAAPSSVRQYLVSLGIAAERLRTVSYGKEFPFDPGHGESSWARNRRANFVVTAK